MKRHQHRAVARRRLGQARSDARFAGDYMVTDEESERLIEAARRQVKEDFPELADNANFTRYFELEGAWVGSLTGPLSRGDP